MSDLGRAAARGGVWSVAGEISSRVSQSLVFFLLARLLDPADFGAAAVAFVCVQVVSSLTYAGLGTVVQALGPDEPRDRTAVGAALAFGGAGGVLLALLAEPLCAVLGVPEATGLVRVVALAPPLAQTGEVLSALLGRDLRFRATGSAVLVASVLSAAAGLALAAAGAGAYALVAQAVVAPTARLLVLVGVRPRAFRPLLDRQALSDIWVPGRNLLAGSAFDTASSNVDSVAVSVFAGAAALGAYGLGFNLTVLPLYVVGYAAGRVALPVYARLLRAGQSLAGAFATTIEATAWLAALPLGFLAVDGAVALEVLFGSSWRQVGPAMPLLAAQGFLRTVESGSQSALAAVLDTRTVRRVQQWQLGLSVVLLPGAVLAWGVVGAASAVTAAVLAGTTGSLRVSTRRTGTRRRVLAARLLEAVAGGLAGGAAGRAALHAVDGVPGVALALVVAVAAWAVVLTVLRPATVRLAVAALRPRSTP